MSAIAVFLLLSIFAPVSQSFSVSSLQIRSTTPQTQFYGSWQPSITTHRKSTMMMTSEQHESSQTSDLNPPSTTTTRRLFGQRLLSTTAAFTVVSSSMSSLPAQASNIDPEVALRSIRRAQRQLETKLKTLVEAQQYQELRDALRADPLGSVRKNCFALVMQDEETRLPAYQTFIAALERLDATAGLIIRGRNVPDLTMLEYYQTTVQSLQVFIDLVAASAANKEATSSPPQEALAQ